MLQTAYRAASATRQAMLAWNPFGSQLASAQPVLVKWHSEQYFPKDWSRYFRVERIVSIYMYLMGFGKRKVYEVSIPIAKGERDSNRPRMRDRIKDMPGLSAHGSSAPTQWTDIIQARKEFSHEKADLALIF
jgi:hypothetical protein